MKRDVNVRFVNVLAQPAEAIRQDAREFWRTQKVLLREEVRANRSNELLCAGYLDNSLIATSSSIKLKVKLLNNNCLYRFRFFIDPALDGTDVQLRLITESFHALAEAALVDIDRPIGAMMVGDADAKNDDRRLAVRREYPMYLMGFNSKDQPIWVHYFKDAVI